MKKMIYFGVILVLTMCVSNGFAQQDTMKSDSKMQTSDKKNSDSKFIMMAATSSMNEIGLSNTALSKSSNEEVKKFAQTAVDDHTKASEELKPIAMSKNVMLPTEMDAKHKSANEKLSALSGEEFDREYVKLMVKDHEKAVAMFQKQADNGKDAEAKAFAAKILPTLQGHLDMARNMMTKMMGNKSDSKTSGM